MNEKEETNISCGVHGPSFALGLVGGALLGAIATIAFATYQEDRFKKVVTRTRAMSDDAQEKAIAIKNKAVAAVNGATESTKRTVQAGTKHAAKKVGDIAGDVEKLAHDVRLAVDPESKA